MATLAVVLGLAPGSAVARWRAPVVVPVWPGAPQQPMPLAVADDGRAAVISTNVLRADLFVVGPGGGATATTVPGLVRPSAIAFAPDGAIVGLGGSLSFEQEDNAASKRRGCCERPALMRWLPGAPVPELTVVQPPIHTNYTTGSLVVDGAGGASFLAVDDWDQYAELDDVDPRDPVIIATRVSADGRVIAQKPLPTRRRRGSTAPWPLTLRARIDGPGATVAFNGGGAWRRMDIGEGGWRLTRAAAGPTPTGDRRGFALDPRGRRVSVFFSRARVLLHVTGRRVLTLQRLRSPARTATRLAVGADGTIAVLVRSQARLILHTIDPRGRRRPAIALGRVRPDPPSGFAVGPRVAVDAQGHAHVIFNPPGGGAIVVGPRGRHRLPGLADGLAVSPGGATAVELRHGGTTLVAVDTRD